MATLIRSSSIVHILVSKSNCTRYATNSVRPLVVGILSFIPPFHPYVFFVGLSLIDSYYLFCHTLMHIISRLLRMHQFRFLHDVTKIQTKKLSILLSFYFHVASPQTSLGVRGVNECMTNEPQRTSAERLTFMRYYLHSTLTPLPKQIFGWKGFFVLR